MSFYGAHSDEQLLRCLQEGEEPAFDELYRRYWRPMYDAACKRLGNDGQAEDIVQEVFIRLWIRKQDLKVDNIGAYLHTAVRYRILSYLSRHKPVQAFFGPFEAMLSESDTPEARLMAKDLMELVYAYAETLPARKRQVFMLHINGVQSTREIAERLGITQKTVQNQLGAALHGLRRNLIPVIMAILSANF